ncbi:MAG: Gfo/Idh/MocA family oxidoreductase [Phycisphaerae bacterium]|nr:Gfo/Idh/MocA family oxidoreductase [Phycisphaerae bacterium]
MSRTTDPGALGAGAEPATPIGLGIVGAGAIGTVHAETALRNGLRVAGVWDMHGARADALVARIGGHAARSLDELLAMPQMEAVAIAVPNVSHADCAVRALERGKHVLLEKPMAMSVAECDRILAAAKASGRTLQLGFVCRGTPASAAAKRFVDAGRLGRIYHAKCSIYRRRGIPGLGGWFTTKAQAGGGPLVDLGVHVLDLVRYLTDKPQATRVSGACYANFGHPIASYRYVDMWAGPPKPDGTFDVEDHATALIRCEGGLTIELNATWAMNQPEGALKDGIFLFGDRGGLAFQIFGSEVTLATEEDGRLVDVKPLLEPGDALGKAWDAQYLQFTQAIRRGVRPHATGEDGRAIQALLEAIERSSAEGRELDVQR